MRELFTRQELSDILELPQRDVNRQLDKMAPSPDGYYSFGAIFTIAYSMTKAKKKGFARPTPRCLECPDYSDDRSSTHRKDYVVSVSSLEAIMKISKILEAPLEATELSSHGSASSQYEGSNDFFVRIRLPVLQQGRSWPSRYRPGNFMTFKRTESYVFDKYTEAEEKRHEIPNIVASHNNTYGLTVPMPPPDLR